MLTIHDGCPEDEPKQVYRPPFIRWFVIGAATVVLATAYNGSALHSVAEEHISPRFANGIAFLVAAAGVLTMLVGGFLLTEHTTVTEAGIEQYNLGRPTLRMLWKDILRVTIHKHRKGSAALIELLGGNSRTIRIDHRLVRFEELQETILQRAAQFDAEIRDQR